LRPFGTGRPSNVGALGSATLPGSSSTVPGRGLLVVRPSLSGPRSAPAALLGGMRRRLGGGSINDASRFSAQVSSEALTGTSERRTRPLRGCQSGIAGDGSARLGATTLDARSPRLAAVEIALCANVLNTRLAAANGVSSPTVAGSSPVHVTARQLVRRGIVDEPAPSCTKDGVLGRLPPDFDLNGVICRVWRRMFTRFRKVEGVP
jgi:hypothetical protein